MAAPPRAPTFPSLDPITRVDDEVSDADAQTFHTPAAPPAMSETTSSVAASASAPSGRSMPARSRLRAILTWKDPKVSGAALAVCLAFFYFTLWKKYSILSVCGAGVGLYLVVGLIVVNVNKVAGGQLDQFIKRPAVMRPVFSTEAAYRWADTLVEEGNEFADDVRDVMYCDKTPLTGAYIGASLFVYLLGKYFSLLPVFFVATMAAFILPIAYEKNKKQVDDAVCKASSVAGKHLESGRKVAYERSVQLKDLAAERSAPFLEKAPAVKGLAEKVGFTPSKKQM